MRGDARYQVFDGLLLLNARCLVYVQVVFFTQGTGSLQLTLFCCKVQADSAFLD